LRTSKPVVSRNTGLEKVDLLHARERRGRRSAFHVGLLVLDQVHAVLRRRGDPLDLQRLDLQLLLEVRDDALAELDGVARGCLSFSNENGSASVRYATVTVFESRIFFQRVIALGVQQCGCGEKCDERGDANHDRFSLRFADEFYTPVRGCSGSGLRHACRGSVLRLALRAAPRAPPFSAPAAAPLARIAVCTPRDDFP
jgi:hypothetical protein